MDLRRDLKEVKEKAEEWLVDHKKDILGGCYCLLCVSAVLAPFVRHRQKTVNARKRHIYDPSMFDSWELRKPLTNNQKLVIEQRRRNGEPLGKILKDMKVLKR